MKITYNPIGYPTMNFSDLANGTIFRYESNGYFMKTRTGGDISRVNTISLKNYSLLYFNGDDQVTPVDATLTIEGEEP